MNRSKLYLARGESGLAGFLILCMTGAFVGYIQIDATRLYERLGYKVVGELTDYIVRGHSEVLLRKTVGPLTGFSPKS